MAFKPTHKRTSQPSNVTLRVNDKDFARIVAAAAAAGLSVSEFTRQCVFYALDNMDAE